jgi:hypothetical protein
MTHTPTPLPLVPEAQSGALHVVESDESIRPETLPSIRQSTEERMIGTLRAIESYRSDEHKNQNIVSPPRRVSVFLLSLFGVPLTVFFIYALVALNVPHQSSIILSSGAFMAAFSAVCVIFVRFVFWLGG